MSESYGNESILLLKGAARVRRRPASMLGSDGLAGARHGFNEIYGNALDEHSAGYGGRLDIRHYLDGSMSVRDYGRGVPMGWNPNPGVNNWNWHVIYNELYGGGKYGDSQEELRQIKDWGSFDPRLYNYLFSVGLNGLGAASTQYTSEFFDVCSYRDGICTKRSFRHGIPLVNGEPYDMFSATSDEIASLPEETEPTDEPNGTFIHWKPDSEVFKDVKVGGDWILETCMDISNIAGIEIHFTDEETGKDITLYPGTVADVVREHGSGVLVSEDTIMTHSTFNHGVSSFSTGEGGSLKDFVWLCKCEIAIGFTDGDGIEHRCFHNSVRMRSGVQYDAINLAIATFIRERCKARGVAVSERDYAGCMMVAVSTYSNYASFRNQTKDGVDDHFIYMEVYNAVYNKLRIEEGKGNQALAALIERVIEDAQVRVAAQEMTKLTKEMAKVKRERTPDKFVSCVAYEEKKYEVVELWITEGDSAKGSVKNARDGYFQAIYPIKGKILNVLKASDKRILENKEIREIFAIIGTGFDLHAKGAKFFDIRNLKVGKIVIATDADEDGYQIRVLLFLVFYKLAPQLIQEGRVYIAETPRFGIDLASGTRIFAKDDNERDAILAEHQGHITRVSRYKGLGEVDADILRETTVHPDTRNLIPLNCDLTSETERGVIDAMFGMDKYKQRKDIISVMLGAGVADMLRDNALMIGEIDEMDIEDETEYEEVVV